MNAQKLGKGVESSTIPLSGESDYSGKRGLKRRHIKLIFRFIVLFWVGSRLGLDVLFCKSFSTVLPLLSEVLCFRSSPFWAAPPNIDHQSILLCQTSR